MLEFIQGIHLIVGLMLLYVLLKYYKDINKFIKNLNKSTTCKQTNTNLKKICKIIKSDESEQRQFRDIKTLFTKKTG